MTNERSNCCLALVKPQVKPRAERFDRPFGTDSFLKTLTQHFVLGFYYHKVPLRRSERIRRRLSLGRLTLTAITRPLSTPFFHFLSLICHSALRDGLFAIPP